jgi:N-dimethylarginine dimethylaminohydrolase
MVGNFNKVREELAFSQWDMLIDSLISDSIEFIEPNEDCPDMFFTANAGFVFNGKVILSSFRYPERQLEEKFFSDWFTSNGFEVIRVKSYYEGEGDHLLDSFKRHWVGYGFRTSLNVIGELESILGKKVYPLELIDTRFYHLDTCFCPLPRGELLWYPDAFSPQSQELIKSKFEKTIEVDEEDALNFTCNAIATYNDIIIPMNKKTTRKLRLLGYNVHELNLSEFIKAGGAAKCLVLNLSNVIV